MLKKITESYDNKMVVRFERPKLAMKVSKPYSDDQKTLIFNIPALAKILGVPCEWIEIFMSIELDQPSVKQHFEGKQHVVIYSGNFHARTFEQTLDKFIRLYVVCPCCLCSEIFIFQGRVKCNDCKYDAPLNTNHELDKYILEVNAGKKID